MLIILGRTHPVRKNDNDLVRFFHPEVESKYYRVPSCPFFSFYVNHKLRMTFFGICFILDISIRIIYPSE